MYELSGFPPWKSFLYGRHCNLNFCTSIAWIVQFALEYIDMSKIRRDSPRGFLGNDVTELTTNHLR